MNNVTIKFGYQNSEQERQYKFDDLPQSVLGGIESAILAINGDSSTVSSLSMFIDDEGHPFLKVTEAIIETIDETIIGGN